ncbi:Low-density lipoprotein receptor domain class A [Aphelenchoides bicaudatus]|nr:Low-density lipoprotein receptor domain class A [Aphelenchoides bicaudatus]
MASNHSSELAASIHTIGERRFYVLPENQIRVIEAPPAYNDALKHPVSSYTNRGFQSYAETELEMRTSNSLPAPEPTSPKLCYSSTSPARINAIGSGVADATECEPGPSTTQNEEEDLTEKRENNEKNDKIDDKTSNESNESTKLDEPNKPSEPNEKRHEKQACEVKVENLDFESWV